MMTESRNGMYAHEVVAVKGSSRSTVLAELERRMIQVPIGGIVQVVSTDPGMSYELWLWTRKLGHVFLGTQEEPGCSRILVKRSR
ncbi:MAG: sulfurtransferase TusA family protein [Gemmatimonadales bacterium]|nr:sulfurtransferase TusA family protein [Gemmatimonadales bacterium]